MPSLLIKTLCTLVKRDGGLGHLGRTKWIGQGRSFRLEVLILALNGGPSLHQAPGQKVGDVLGQVVTDEDDKV
jgi:predicted glycosyltransferase